MGCIGLVNLTSFNPYRPVLTKTSNTSYNSRRPSMAAIRSESIATEKLGITIEKNPPESKLTQLGVRSWSKPVLTKTSNNSYNSRRPSMAAIRSKSIATEKLGITIEKNPPESKLTQLGVRSWSKWGCPPSKFPWTFTAKETIYLLEGKVKVYPDGSEEGVKIEAGDLVVFPKGMSCTWDVSVAVDKHYRFE